MDTICLLLPLRAGPRTLIQFKGSLTRRTKSFVLVLMVTEDLAPLPALPSSSAGGACISIHCSAVDGMPSAASARTESPPVLMFQMA